MSPPDSLALIGPDHLDESTVVVVGGDHADRIVTTVRREVAAGRTVAVAPDDAVGDRDDWIALVSVAVVEGAAAVRTCHGRDARRILDMHHAIVTGGSELDP